MKISASNSIVLVVDIQERLIGHMREHERLLSQSVKLLKGADLFDVPVVATEQYPAGLGVTVADIKSVWKSRKTIEKTSFSSFGAEDMDLTLKAYNKPNVVLIGMETHVCVFQTCQDLLEEGYLPVLVADCLSSRDQNDHDTALQQLQSWGCVVITLENLLFQWCGHAKHDSFKQLSALVK